ncbi:MAG: 4-(cytidine 5'-diphospho)-2-C-methyl-D-erythritol kinase, partial [Desulfobacteraceae bacterium]
MAPRTYTAKAPAKLNLRLKVIGRRPDGYHELVSLMVPVDICDVLEFRPIPEKI